MNPCVLCGRPGDGTPAMFDFPLDGGSAFSTVPLCRWHGRTWREADVTDRAVLAKAVDAAEVLLDSAPRGNA
jgi:hypothetical protein